MHGVEGYIEVVRVLRGCETCRHPACACGGSGGAWYLQCGAQDVCVGCMWGESE